MREATLKELGYEFATTRSEESFRKLYDRIRPGLENHLFKMTHDRAAAGHLLSETMTAVYDKIGQYKPEWHISTWIYRIAYINFCHELRVNKRKNPLTYIADSPEGIGATQYRQAEHAQAVDEQYEDGDVEAKRGAMLDAVPDAVTELPEDLRAVVEQKFYMGKTLRDIAAETGESVPSLTRKLNEAKRRIKKVVCDA